MTTHRNCIKGMPARMTALVVGALSSVAVLAACGAAFIAPQIDSELTGIYQEKYPEAPPDALADGRQLFVGSCGKGGFCHKLPTPKSRSEEQWPLILDRMAKKAKLDDDQKELVLGFVLAVRDLPDAPAAE
jgi:hypothetical protein